MIDNFAITLTQFEKSGSMGKLFIPVEILKLIFSLETKVYTRFYSPFPLLERNSPFLANEFKLKRN